MHIKMKKAVLTLQVTYSGPDADEKTITAILEGLVSTAANRGMLTDGLDLEVERKSYEVKVEELR